MPISVTTGCPYVIVPVLSNATILILWADSSESPPFISIPFSAPLPVPTIIAVGVASPSAHGQAITRTDINIVRENSNVSCPIKYQPNPEIRAIVITNGTNIPDTLSAKLAIGAFLPWASSTSLII